MTPIEQIEAEIAKLEKRMEGVSDQDRAFNLHFVFTKHTERIKAYKHCLSLLKNEQHGKDRQ